MPKVKPSNPDIYDLSAAKQFQYYLTKVAVMVGRFDFASKYDPDGSAIRWSHLPDEAHLERAEAKLQSIVDSLVPHVDAIKAELRHRRQFGHKHLRSVPSLGPRHD